jgi:hypothetical protein
MKMKGIDLLSHIASKPNVLKTLLVKIHEIYIKDTLSLHYSFFSNTSHTVFTCQ